ncbi:transposase [Bradymonadaceae bacterium TMQ3]|uniref:DDE domain-containing protein n=1 Tax=Lujinxingia sediminis TaxID=2480984 RepID=A0ABY0CPT1_9DELT|nr:integrase core domain-containing protein [Lujinxingia sediminis]RDV36899.1 transposase [Bradymonadaceae bacterium TMQ3]RVU42126.1 DDE domain-containing protein [Lujinxingia sediminis]TXC69521.1 transposase [Bradymonadales bacterium TMQ1]
MALFTLTASRGPCCVAIKARCLHRSPSPGVASQYGLIQEFIRPYTPQQNGLIECFFRSLKEECIWMTNFKTFAQAREVIETWVEFYNTERPHQALGYTSPAEYGAQFGELVA